ncbi:MAG: glutathione S-transferase family protein [Rubrobacter sp.]|nr:glutathione S-transferase family protein [Rubrobacter sp.]
MKPMLYSTQRCPYARRTRIVLREKRIDFDIYEVDLRNKSEEFLRASPYGKVPVFVVNGTYLYESNIVNEYLDEVYEAPPLMPNNPERRALARIWMAFANEYFFPAIYRACMGYEWGLSAEQVQEACEKLGKALLQLEHQLETRQYLVGEYTLADIAHAGTFPRLRELADGGDASLERYPNVTAWVEQVESRESYKASL